MPGINWKPVQSPNVEKIAHDAAARKLYVQFKDGGRYVYHDVSAAAHEHLMDAKSIGSHLYNHIVGKFRGEKMKDE